MLLCISVDRKAGPLTKCMKIDKRRIDSERDVLRGHSDKLEEMVPNTPSARASKPVGGVDVGLFEAYVATTII